LGPADDRQSAFERSAEKSGAKGDQYRHAEVRPTLAGMDVVHQGSVITHLGRQGPEEVADPLLVLKVHTETAEKHDAGFGADAFTTGGKLPNSINPFMMFTPSF
jgi:hypothetical protein